MNSSTLIRVTSLVLGVALVSYGVGAVIASRNVSGMETNPTWWLQVIALVGSGTTACVWPLLTAKGQAVVTPVIIRPDKKPLADKSKGNCTCRCCSSEIVEPAERKDLDSLHHLADRLSDQPQGLAFCRQLQDCLFEKHHGVHDNVAVESILNASVGEIQLSRSTSKGFSAKDKGEESDGE